MESLAVELLEEIGLYLDPKSYHSLRNSLITKIPFVQRVLPCYFEHAKVIALLDDFPRKDLREYFKITRMNSELIQKLLFTHHYNLLVPYAQQVIEIIKYCNTISILSYHMTRHILWKRHGYD